MYLLALFCPPLAVFLTGRVFQALFSLFLLPFYFPAALWALLVVSAHKADQRARRFAKTEARATVTTNVNVNNLIHLPPTSRESNALVEEVLAERREDSRRALARFERRLELEAAERRTARNAMIRAAPMRVMWLIDDARLASIGAYRTLPEWAQPITWGLALGTPFSMVAALLFLKR